MYLQEFTKEIKQKRLTGNWYTFIGSVNGKEVRIKGFKTWLQIYTINGIDNSNCMERSIKQFNSDLTKRINIT